MAKLSAITWKRFVWLIDKYQNSVMIDNYPLKHRVAEKI